MLGLVLTGILCLVLISHAQPDSKRITFYTSQTSYSIPVLDRNGAEYVGLIEALEPLGPITARPDGKKWKLKFRNIEAQFEVDKKKAKIHGKNVEMAAPFLMETGHGLVPASGLKQFLQLFDVSPVDYHEAARRVFVGATVVHFSVRKTESGRVAFSFSSPVNPFIATEAGRLRMVFDREPVQADSRSFTFDDKVITSASYSEFNGAAELSVLGTAPMAAVFSDDRRVITISGVVPPPPPAVAQTAPANASVPPAHSPTTQQTLPPSKPRTFVIIDAAHGGSDAGAMLSAKLAEKDVTLAVAHKLLRELETRGISAVLLREGDSTLSDDQRASVANASNSALYLSLHASGTGLGIHVYSSAIAPETRAALAFVPVQMAQASQVNQSRQYAVSITQSMSARDVRAVALPGYVAPLNSVAIPAIAVEFSPREVQADELGTGSYQQWVATVIANALISVQSQQSKEGQR